jgi:hypothetical protein
VRKQKIKKQKRTNKRIDKKSHLFLYSFFIYSLWTSIEIQAQQSTAPPRLVVNIVIDQLREDYLHYFSHTFGEKGFKRLMHEALTYYSVEFGFPNLDEASSIASIYTGTYPYYHGVIGTHKYDFAKNGEISIMADDNYLGNYTSDKLSPLPLQASTICDELKIAAQGKNKIYAVAPNAEEAIISGGKYADGVFWLDDYSGKWATSTYYREMPACIDRYNTYQAIGVYPECVWTQSYTYYDAFPYSTQIAPFSYNFARSDKDRYLKIKQTALINVEITNVVEKLIENASLGIRPISDLLAITYYAGNYKLRLEPDEYGSEIQDIYYRLDKELERLFLLIDKKIGMENTLIVLTSTGYYDSANATSANFQPKGEFYPNRCTSLLNMYLIAVYGQGNWVNAYYNQQIYLNKKLAEEKQIRWKELIRDAAEFVAQFSGVQEVTTSEQWMNDDAEHSVAFRKGMNKKLSGDLFIALQPGWQIFNEKNSSKNNYYRNTVFLTPLFILYEKIKKDNIYRKIKVTEIAPTLSHILRIRPPNACKDFPLQEIINYK